MKFLLLVYLLSGGIAYPQAASKSIIVFFMNQFNNDSVHVFLNKRELYKVKLKTDPSTSQCSFFFTIPNTESIQELTLYDIDSKKRFKTITRKCFNYLYIFKSENYDYRFDYSNKLLLSE